MSRVTQVVVGGALLFGVLGCTAQADTVSTDATLTSGQQTPAVSVSRQDIQVEIDPKKIVGGSTKSVHITARCPLPQGGTEYRATARSDAFTGLVTLVAPAPAEATPTSATVPMVRGSATIKAAAKPGGYRVQVRCDATNDIGSASFRIVAPEPDRTESHTRIPTRAPHAGGGGTAAGGPTDESGLPTGVTVVVLLAALGVGIGVVRRRSGA